MSNISLIEDERETGNKWLRDTLDKLEEDGVILRDVVVVANTDKGFDYFYNEMYDRDLAYLNNMLDKNVKSKL